jgi:RimJ/RimL family protein N-acetyltransferase
MGLSHFTSFVLYFYRNHAAYHKNKDFMLPIETERLKIRNFQTSDATFILRILNEPSFIQNIADRGVRTLEQAEKYLVDGPLKSYAAHGFGLYLVEQKDSGQPIGMCGLIKRPQLEDVDLGYAFLPAFSGQGLAIEAACAVLSYGHSTLKLGKIVAIVLPTNQRSIRLLEKLQFRQTGTIQLRPDSEILAFFEHP